MNAPWDFYGRELELAQLRTIFARGRWFFVQISGRRCIGKASLVRQAPTEIKDSVYVQIPDSDPAGVVSTVRDFFAALDVARPPTDLRSFATRIASLCEEGRIVVLDEFQYFHRKALAEFNSALQAVVDDLQALNQRVKP